MSGEPATGRRFWTPFRAIGKWSLQHDRFVRNVFLLAGGTAAGQAVLMGVQPILTRLYTPVDFGALQVYLSAMSIVMVAAALRYEYAIPLPEDDETAANVLVLVLSLMCSVGVLTALAIWLFGDRFTDWTNAPTLRPYLWLLPFGLVGGGFYSAISYWTVRKKWFEHLAKTKIRQALWQAGIQTGAGALRSGSLGLLLGDVVGRVAGGGTLARLTWQEHHEAFSKVSFRGVRQAAVRYRRFPLVTGVSAILSGAGTQLPPLLIAALYGSNVLGWFALGQRLLVAPLALVGLAAGQVYLGEAPPLSRGDAAGLRSLYLTTAGRLLLFCAIPIAGLAVGGPWLFVLVFGSSWGESGEYVRICSPAFLAQAAVGPVVQTLNVMERQDLQLVADLGYPIAMTGSLLLAHALAVPARTAIVMYSVAMFTIYAVLFFVTLWAIGHPKRA